MIILFGYQLQLRDKIAQHCFACLVCDRSILEAQDYLVFTGGPGAIQEIYPLTLMAKNL